MQRLIQEIDKPAKAKVNKIRYERSAHSILNKNIRTIDTRSPKIEGGNTTLQISEGSRLNDSYPASPDGRHRYKESSDNSYYEDNLGIVPESSKYNSKTPARVHQRSKSSIKNSERRRFQDLSFGQYEPKPFVKYDYLAEVRNKKQEKGGYDYKTVDFWKSDIQDSNYLNRYDRIKFKTNEIERKAKLKEDKISLTPANGKYNDEVNSMYMDAIKAKAALLSSL